jgi:hypothetical protein
MVVVYGGVASDGGVGGCRRMRRRMGQKRVSVNVYLRGWC